MSHDDDDVPPTLDASGSLSPNAPTRSATPDGSTARADAARPASPVRDASRYQILGEHGRGGLGRVFRAHDRELGRDVAIKELLARDVVSEVRFQREALITARLEHPGIVPVHEAGRWADGAPFYAMKLVSGRPLRALIAERPTVEQRIELLHHVIAVADAIAYAHDRHIIHRDLKPSNVIVGDFGETIVIDWGLAKELAHAEPLAEGSGERASDDDGLTNAGRVLGTPSYMAPEQRRGEPVDQRADVFAIGTMLWELCAVDKLPEDVAARHRLLRAAGIDRDLITILDKALAAEPARRYPHAGALAADLKAFKSGARITARHYSLPAMLAHWTRRHRALAGAGLAIAGLVVASLIALAVSYRARLETRAAERLAEATFTEAELEQGRAALLHHEPDAQRHLANAYEHAPSPSTAFMLARASQPALAELARLPGTAGRVYAARFSPDGRRIAVADDKGVQVWDAGTYRVERALPHPDIPYDLAFSRDGQSLFTVAGDSVRIWNLATGALVRTLTYTKNKVRFSVIALSPDGARVAAMSYQGEFGHVWDVATGASLAELHETDDSTPEVEFSADDRWLIASGGKEAHVYDCQSWKVVATIPGPVINGMTWDPTGPRVLTGNGMGEVAIWAIPSGERVFALRALGDPIDAVAFSPDGKLVAAAGRDGTAYVWHADTGKVQSHGNYLQAKMLSIEFDRSSTKLVAASGIGMVAVADAMLGMPITILEGPRAVIVQAYFDPDARRVVGASWDGTARVWDATAPYQRWESPQSGNDCGMITGLELDRRFLAVWCRAKAIRIWDTERGQLLAELPTQTDVEGDFASPYPAVSVGGDRAAIAQGNTVLVYALPGSTVVRTITLPAPVDTVSFAPTGRDVIAGAIDGSLILTHDDGSQRALPNMPGGIDTAAILADGRVIAAGAQRQLRIHDAHGAITTELALAGRAALLRPSTDGRRLITLPSLRREATSTELWDLEHPRRLAEIQGDVGVRAARLTPALDVLTANADGAVQLYDGATGRLRKTYRGGTRFLADATLSPDGAMVIAGGGDGFLRFWDAATGLPLWTMLAHKSFLVGIQYQGNDILTRGFGGEIARWVLPPSSSVIEACKRREPCASKLR